ncbi:hypothetical protein KAR91_27065 [Candidatus Pacearchaeota archaeon]|nr:hypothetical protein [Candidatus Pacearchaeota archaeon]
MDKENEVKKDGTPSVPATEAPATEAPATDAPATEVPATEAPATEAPRDPVKEELEKIDNGKKKYTKRERLNHAKSKIDEQIGELDEEEGIAPEVTNDTPVTVGMLDKREREQAKNTAIDIAEGIEDEDERKLTIHYLENRIKPSGDPQADVTLARSAVNSIRNGEIAQEMSRQNKPAQHSSSQGNPKPHEQVFQPTEEERVFMQEPYNLKKEDIIEAREKAQANQG